MASISEKYFTQFQSRADKKNREDQILLLIILLCFFSRYLPAVNIIKLSYILYISWKEENWACSIKIMYYGVIKPRMG
jgi:hypothetical protein